MEIKWTTGKKKELCPMTEMSPTHCKNAIKSLLKTKSPNALLYYILYGYNTRRKELYEEFDDNFSDQKADSSILDKFEFNEF